MTDDELAELALAADPDAAPDPEAVPVWSVLAEPGPGGDLLPTWYMPSPMAGGGLRRGWRRVVILVVIASFLAINAYGLCSTYGWVSLG